MNSGSEIPTEIVFRGEESYQQQTLNRESDSPAAINLTVCYNGFTFKLVTSVAAASVLVLISGLVVLLLWAFKRNRRYQHMNEANEQVELTDRLTSRSAIYRPPSYDNNVNQNNYPTTSNSNFENLRSVNNPFNQAEIDRFNNPCFGRNLFKLTGFENAVTHILQLREKQNDDFRLLKVFHMREKEIFERQYPDFNKRKRK